MIKDSELRKGNMIFIRDISNPKQVIGEEIVLSVGQDGSVTTDDNLFIVREILDTHVMGIGISTDKYFGNVFSNLFPIPLTPEILEKCGFEETSMSFADGSTAIIRRSIDLTDRISVTVNGNKVIISEKPERIGTVKYIEIEKVESVHRLQNIIHSFTGEELQVTL